MKEMIETLVVEVDVKIVNNVLFCRLFHFGTEVGGLNILWQAGIMLTKTEKRRMFNSIFRSLPKLKMFLKVYSDCPFCGDLKMVKQFNFHPEVMENLCIDMDVNYGI